MSYLISFVRNTIRNQEQPILDLNLDAKKPYLTYLEKTLGLFTLAWNFAIVIILEMEFSRALCHNIWTFCPNIKSEYRSTRSFCRLCLAIIQAASAEILRLRGFNPFITFFEGGESLSAYWEGFKLLMRRFVLLRRLFPSSCVGGRRNKWNLCFLTCEPPNGPNSILPPPLSQ